MITNHSVIYKCSPIRRLLKYPSDGEKAIRRVNTFQKIIYFDQTNDDMHSYKAIIQLTSPDPKVYKSTIRQIFNLLEHFQDDIQVKIICHGASAPFCLSKQNAFTEEIISLLQKKVSIEICRNMLISNDILPSTLIPGISIIPSGMAELVIRQQEGWSYIKAGF